MQANEPRLAGGSASGAQEGGRSRAPRAGAIQGQERRTWRRRRFSCGLGRVQVSGRTLLHCCRLSRGGSPGGPEGGRGCRQKAGVSGPQRGAEGAEQGPESDSAGVRHCRAQRASGHRPRGRRLAPRFFLFDRAETPPDEGGWGRGTLGAQVVSPVACVLRVNVKNTLGVVPGGVSRKSSYP